MTKLLAIFLVATLVGCGRDIEQVTPVHIAEAQKLCESSSGFTIDRPRTHLCGLEDSCTYARVRGRITCSNGKLFYLEVSPNEYP